MPEFTQFTRGNMSDYPKIYFQSIEDTGEDSGIWIDLPDYYSASDIGKDLTEFFGDREYLPTECEDFPDDYKDVSLEEILEISQAIEQHGLGPIEAFLSDWSISELANFEDCYEGLHESEKDFAENLYHEMGEIPDGLLGYAIDWQYVAKELFSSDFLSVESGYKVYVFRRC